MQRDLGLIQKVRFDSYLWFGVSLESNNFFMQQGPGEVDRVKLKIKYKSHKKKKLQLEREVKLEINFWRWIWKRNAERLAEWH